MNKRDLTARWIKNLKTSSIVKPQPDQNGKLIYNRPVHLSDLVSFLRRNTEFGDEKISAAIKEILMSGDGVQSRTVEPPEQVGTNGQAPAPQLGHRKPFKPTPKPQDVSDVEYRDINEDFREIKGPELSEKQIELIFDVITRPDPVEQKVGSVDRESEIRQIKSVLTSKLTPDQIKMLYRELKNYVK